MVCGAGERPTNGCLMRSPMSYILRNFFGTARRLVVEQQGAAASEYAVILGVIVVVVVAAAAMFGVRVDARVAGIEPGEE